MSWLRKRSLVGKEEEGHDFTSCLERESKKYLLVSKLLLGA